jgi:hypothetical protein
MLKHKREGLDALNTIFGFKQALPGVELMPDGSKCTRDDSSVGPFMSV